MRKIKIKERTAKILDGVFAVVYLALAFWVDWRIGCAFLAYDLSNVFASMEDEIKADKRARDLLAIIRKGMGELRREGNGTQTTTT